MAFKIHMKQVRLVKMRLNETRSEDCVGKQMSDTFPIQNGIKQEHTLTIFENRVMMKIFGLKRDEMVRGWRKLHNEELHILYFSLNITTLIESTRIRSAGHAA
jgi:hypothetical protein